MIDLNLPVHMNPVEDVPSALFQAHERIRELERETLGLKSELVIRRKEAAEAREELDRFRRAFQSAAASLRVLRSEAKQAVEEWQRRQAELDSVEALKARIAELEAQVQGFEGTRRDLEAEAARWQEEAQIRLELQDFLTRQLDEARQKEAESKPTRVARGLLRRWREGREPLAEE